MSFVPNPTQANASNNPSNAKGVNPASAAGGGAAAPPSAEETGDDLIFKIRTYDVYWVEKNALMYRDGVSKVR
jgi:ATP-dependent RNA helicase DDX60